MKRKHKNQWFVKAVLCGWGFAMVAVVGSLMVSHWVRLPHPTADDQAWSATLASHRSASAARDWTVFHFLNADCACSRRILVKLADESPHRGVCERIVILGSEDKTTRAAIENGFEVEFVTRAELDQRYAIAAVPMFAVVAPDGSTKYSGGYTSRKQGLDVQHRDIIGKLVAGESSEPLPVYGCAVSKQLQAAIDPFGIKYGREN